MASSCSAALRDTTPDAGIPRGGVLSAAMSTLAPLHRRLLRALDLSSLLVLGALAPACAGAQDQDTAGTKAQTAKPDATTPTKVEPTKVEPTQVEPTQVEPTQVEPTQAEPTQAEPTQVEPTKVDPPKSDPPKINPVTVRSLPRCPTIEWCGTKPLVEAMRAKDRTPLPPDVEGCPGLVKRKEPLDPKLLAGQEPPPANTFDHARVDVEATNAKRTAGDANSCCYEWTIPCPGGRPLLVDGRPWLAALQPGRTWSAQLPAASTMPALSERLRDRIAAAWLRDALTEHASIASFARARAELAAIAAPRALLDACERAAEDEVEHARLCFALAERWSGRSLEPTALPSVTPRSNDPLAIALDTFLEGCVGETIAAACARRAAGLASDPVARAVLERIADDETEHAALAWRTIAWLSHREGPHVLAAIIARADELRPQPAAAAADEPDAALLLAHGRLDDRTLAQTRAQAWRELIDPLLAELHAAASRGPRADRTPQPSGPRQPTAEPPQPPRRHVC